MNLEQSIENLIKILVYQTKLYFTLVKLAEEKSDIIIENNISKIETHTQKEKEFVSEMQKLEAVRMQIVEQITVLLGEGGRSFTVSEIIQRIKGGQREKLSDARQGLIERIEALKKKNELNEKLIKNQLEYIDFSINLFAGDNLATNDYGQSGKYNDKKKSRNMFDASF